MNSLFREANLNSAFYIASEIIKTIADDNFDTRLDELLFLECVSHDDFIIDLLSSNIQCLLKPQKETLLHKFIASFFETFINNDFYYFADGLYDLGEYDVLHDFFEERKLMLDDYDVNSFEWEEEIDILLEKFEAEYEKDTPQIKPLEEAVQSLMDKMQNMIMSKIDTIVENTFFLLYSNKRFLYDFNHMLSKYVLPEALPSSIFNDSNHVIRCTNRPKWLENALLYRDRATCQHCGADLSNSFKIMDMGELHFDHIIPLEKGGTNDATNYQLLCSACNRSKNDSLILPTYQYQMYW